jgi:outer membrane protein OmpA-like peptidoglycan-associated protein
MLLAQADRVRAQQPSETQIIDALKPKATTRGLTRSLGGGAPAPNPAEKRFIDSIRSKPTRSITVEERTQVAKIAETKPGIDLEIYFDFNSWAITPKAMPTLITLGRALSNPEFKGATFLVGGHTDAKGSHEYNKELSEKRAEAVKRFLVENFKVSVDTLMPIGFGKEQLKNKADPYADENRRVQVVNMTAQ